MRKLDIEISTPKLHIVYGNGVSPEDSSRKERYSALLKESKDEVNKAHKCQTQLIQQEASGNKTDVSVVLIHAQDHLMNTMNYQMLADEIIDIHERLHKLENK